jgi:hypothetical protein
LFPHLRVAGCALQAFVVLWRVADAAQFSIEEELDGSKLGGVRLPGSRNELTELARGNRRLVAVVYVSYQLVDVEEIAAGKQLSLVERHAAAHFAALRLQKLGSFSVGA